MDWDVETDSEHEEEEPLDFDMLDDDETPRKPCTYPISFVLPLFSFIYISGQIQGQRSCTTEPGYQYADCPMIVASVTDFIACSCESRETGS
jgi:hypothetical protein